MWTERAARDWAAIIRAHDFPGVVAAVGEGTAGVHVGREGYGFHRRLPRRRGAAKARGGIPGKVMLQVRD